MTKLREIYLCEVCGNVVEMVGEGAGQLVCCGQPMVKQEEKGEDKGLEKHLPVASKCPETGGTKVIVGDVEHPMIGEHYITFIEVISGDKVCRAELKPVQKPEASFSVSFEKVDAVRSYCNVHGLWEIKL